MALVLMAWVCVAVTLARLNSGESVMMNTGGRLAGRDQLYNGVHLAKKAPLAFPVPVWKYLQGESRSGLS